MPRTSRMLIGDENAVYHVMSRTALDGFPIGDIEKDWMLNVIKRFAGLYLFEIMGFCLMGNHFHLLVKMLPEGDFSDDAIMECLKRFYGDARDFSTFSVLRRVHMVGPLQPFIQTHGVVA